MEKLESTIGLFQSVDKESRLELLLDYARRLPPLDNRFHAARDAGLGAVPECQTPVFLAVEAVEGCLRIHVDVGEEAPTVKGLLSILVDALDRQPVQAIAEIPANLLSRLGLQDVIRMNRAVGFSAMIGRLKIGARNATEGRQ
jgi:cysteine desulfuration protein SufE